MGGAHVNVCAIDPGADTCANAIFARDVLIAVSFALPPDWDPLADEPSIVVVERMQADERTRHVDVRHVLACQWNAALCAGCLAGRTGAAVQWYTPTEWKGSEPKPIQHKRLWAVLTPAERIILGGRVTEVAIDRAVEKGALRRWKISGADCYPRACKVHNLLDAAALGAVHLGRLERQ
jgi:hypothetical protein